MKTAIFPGALAALSLIVSAISHAEEFDVGALHVDKHGAAGTPVILIPGLASGPWVFADSATRLEKNHVVYLLTLPGFDGRPARPGATLESLQEDLRGLIDREHLHKPVLIGHSLGGALSLAFAAKHSELIGCVVAVEGLPVFPGTENIRGDRAALAQQTRAQITGMTREQFASYQQQYMRGMGAIDPIVADRLAVLSSRSDVAATADFAAQLFALDLRPQLAGIRVPVVEIVPAYPPDLARLGLDEAGKANYYRGLLSGIADLSIVSISPARHFVMFDQPARFAAALDAAFAGH